MKRQMTPAPEAFAKLIFMKLDDRTLVQDIYNSSFWSNDLVGCAHENYGVEKRFDMKSRTIELLTFAKAFYYHGMTECLSNTDVGNMLAILNFHDAVEFCARAIIEEFDVQRQSGETLTNLVTAIDKHYKATGSPLKLPLPSQISGLNTLRNNVKHHATPPHSTATENAKVHTATFLESSISEYFQISFDEVSLVALVKSDGIRELLVNGEKAIAEENYLDALICIKQACIEGKPSDAAYLSQNTHGRGYISQPHISSRRIINSSDPYSSDIKQLASTIKEMCSHLENMKVELDEARENLALILMGVDSKCLHRFLQTTPHFNFCSQNEYEVFWGESVIPTREMAVAAM